MVLDVTKGINVCLLAYGQTGCGKTHTIMGRPGDLGMLPRSMASLFRYISDIRNSSESAECVLLISYVEIYLDRVMDLLQEGKTPNSPKEDLSIKEDAQGNFYVQNLKTVAVASVEECMQHIEVAESRRHFAATNFNETSSRSHVVFSAVVETALEVDGLNISTKGELLLVDLAGNERVSAAASGVAGAKERLAEGQAINKSLFLLSEVISKLAKRQGMSGAEAKKLFVPWRDSSLTRVIKRGLAGNSRACVICALHPSTQSLEISLSTLRFAEKCKTIKKKVTTNFVSPEQSLIAEQKSRISLLQNALEAIQQKTGVDVGSVSTSVSEPSVPDELKTELASTEKTVADMESLLKTRLAEASKVMIKSQRASSESSTYSEESFEEVVDLKVANIDVVEESVVEESVVAESVVAESVVEESVIPPLDTNPPPIKIRRSVEFQESPAESRELPDSQYVLEITAPRESSRSLSSGKSRSASGKSRSASVGRSKILAQTSRGKKSRRKSDRLTRVSSDVEDAIRRKSREHTGRRTTVVLSLQAMEKGQLMQFLSKPDEDPEEVSIAKRLDLLRPAPPKSDGLLANEELSRRLRMQISRTRRDILELKRETLDSSNRCAVARMLNARLGLDPSDRADRPARLEFADLECSNRSAIDVLEWETVPYRVCSPVLLSVIGAVLSQAALRTTGTHESPFDEARRLAVASVEQGHFDSVCLALPIDDLMLYALRDEVSSIKSFLFESRPRLHHDLRRVSESLKRTPGLISALQATLKSVYQLFRDVTEHLEKCKMFLDVEIVSSMASRINADLRRLNRAMNSCQVLKSKIERERQNKVLYSEVPEIPLIEIRPENDVINWREQLKGFYLDRQRAMLQQSISVAEQRDREATEMLTAKQEQESAVLRANRWLAQQLAQVGGRTEDLHTKRAEMEARVSEGTLRHEFLTTRIKFKRQELELKFIGLEERRSLRVERQAEIYKQVEEIAIGRARTELELTEDEIQAVVGSFELELDKPKKKKKKKQHVEDESSFEPESELKKELEPDKPKMKKKKRRAEDESSFEPESELKKKELEPDKPKKKKKKRRAEDESSFEPESELKKKELEPDKPKKKKKKRRAEDESSFEPESELKKKELEPDKPKKKMKELQE
ncbi:MAG: hypothetical protein KVP17_000057 [Porospora cf. gigantea B]|nr:MAG: hypothetical protein KVP17_000057 [Porospora cf. gigantea B]